MATTTEATGEGQAAEALEGAEGGHGGGVFPPLDQKTFPSQILWLVIFFALLYALMSKVVLPKIASILEARRNRIEGDLARAAALKEETEAALNSYNKALTDARNHATDIATKTRETVNADILAQQHALDATLAEKAAVAESQIAKAKAKAMDSVADIASETASEIVAALTGGRVTKAELAKALKG
jgi:F-type H+-transporting ATPase subunit b